MFLRQTWPAIVWALFILLLCGLPGDGLPSSSFFDRLQLDKFVHVFLFMVLVVLLLTGFRKQYTFRELRYHAKSMVFVIAVIYGVLIEGLQGTVFIDRNFDLLDMGANMVGSFSGLLAFRVLYGKDLTRDRG